jgi:hypothetical protein
MNPIESQTVYCPWCGSPIALVVDCSGGSQEYVEDCAVCCQPMVVRVTVDTQGEGVLAVSVFREDE